RDFHVTGVQTCALPICRYRIVPVGSVRGCTALEMRRAQALGGSSPSASAVDLTTLYGPFALQGGGVFRWLGNSQGNSFLHLGLPSPVNRPVRDAPGRSRGALRPRRGAAPPPPA